VISSSSAVRGALLACMGALSACEPEPSVSTEYPATLADCGPIGEYRIECGPGITRCHCVERHPEAK
jgi:hypothetical protein